MADKMMVGGQAVIEGVMMRGSSVVATAVREPSGEIAVEVKPVNSIAKKHFLLREPFIRGVVALGESMVMGLKSLSYSARMAGEDESERLTNKDIALTMIFSLAFAVVLFVIIPTVAATYLKTSSDIVKNFGEGVVRLVVFFLYMFAVSRAKDIQRVFQYHGAEHKTIHAYEAGVELTPANVQKFSRLHPRCGTSFLLIVMLVSIVLFSFLGWPNIWERIISRIILLPVVAGISYEFIRLAGKSENVIVKIVSRPGMWLQYLTTREPDDDMIEVAVTSLNAVLEASDEDDDKIEFIQ